MLSQLCALIVVAVAVNGCVKTGNKRHGEACLCSDVCLDGSYCLTDDDGEFTCQCLPCQSFSSDFGQCVDLPGIDESCSGQCAPGLMCGMGKCVSLSLLPGPGEVCTDVCAADLPCLTYTDGTQACGDCPVFTVYNPVSQICEEVPIPNLNEPCTTFCAPNLTCQNTGFGDRLCQDCPKFHKYDPALLECIAPGFEEPCLYACSPPYICTNNTDESATCQECPLNYYFDEDTVTCVKAPKMGEVCEDMCSCDLECTAGSTPGEKTCTCPAASSGYDEITGCALDCIQNKTNGCRCKPDGNYPACSPLCEDGRYITCYQNRLYLRDCARGSYRHPNGTYFLARTVFDPVLKRCEWESTFCPRPLDDNFP